MQIISAKCFGCHANFAGYLSDADWKASGYVVAGSLNGSRLYYRLSGAGLGIAPETMPQGGSLNSNELGTIRAWILNMPP